MKVTQINVTEWTASPPLTTQASSVCCNWWQAIMWNIYIHTSLSTWQSGRQARQSGPEKLNPKTGRQMAANAAEMGSCLSQPSHGKSHHIRQNMHSEASGCILNNPRKCAQCWHIYTNYNNWSSLQNAMGVKLSQPHWPHTTTFICIIMSRHAVFSTAECAFFIATAHFK